MIDFQNGAYLKLKQVQPGAYAQEVGLFLIEGEQIIAEFKSVRDGVVFTNKRVIAINVQGMTGTKREYASLPYSKVQSFSVETAGMFDMDAELDLWFSGLGKIRFEFSSNSNVYAICRMISTFVL